jgi:hypothetical protein
MTDRAVRTPKAPMAGFSANTSIPMPETVVSMLPVSAPPVPRIALSSAVSMLWPSNSSAKRWTTWTE